MRKLLGKPLLWSLPSLFVLLATAGVVWYLVDQYRDPALQWTIAAAAFTTAGLLVAAVGLPIALYQLVALDRNVSRPHDLIKALNQFRIEASPWVKVLYEPTTDAFARAADLVDFQGWVDQVAEFIRTNMDEAEEQSFRNAGIPKQTVHELEDKLVYIRDQLIPKVREGYW